MNRVILRIAVLFVLFSFCRSAEAGIRKGPYLLFEGSNTSMTVLWQTDAEESNVLSWGTDTSYNLGQAAVGTYGSDYQHKYVITDLQPGTGYYYQVAGYGTGSFRTAPVSGATAVKIFAYGDTRSNPTAHGSVAGRMIAAYGSDPNYQSIALHAGDWVASNGESYWTNEWFVNSNAQLRQFQSELPIAGARGNHEGTGTVYAKYFPEPYISGFYWSFDYGPAHVAVVDQYTAYTVGSTQYNWLAADLAATPKPWKIVVMHEPGWSAGGHANNTTVQTVLQPLFIQYGVQMVIAGHNHYYARAVADYIDHLTLGGGGAPLYTPDAGQPNIVTVDESYHFAEIDINGNTMHYSVIRDDGSVIESRTIYDVNQTPTANAGNDQNVYDTDGNGSSDINLNGSASSDLDGAISAYVWKEGDTEIATGVSPTVSLAVGVHTLTLTVTDNRGAAADDTVQITVLPCNITNTNILNACYDTVSAAYQDAGEGDVIRLVNNTYAESFNADRPVGVVLEGGYDSAFSSPSGFSSIQSLTIQSGTLAVSNISITSAE